MSERIHPKIGLHLHKDYHAEYLLTWMYVEERIFKIHFLQYKKNYLHAYKPINFQPENSIIHFGINAEQTNQDFATVYNINSLNVKEEQKQFTNRENN